MSPLRHARSLPLFLPLLLALSCPALAQDSWKAKQISEWSADDAKDVLNRSPWVKTFTPDIDAAQPSPQRRGMGRGGGLGIGGVGIGVPGVPGMGRRGMGSPRAQQPDQEDSRPESGQTPQLMLRWESALPIRTAQLKIRDSAPPEFEEQYYAVALYGLPDRAIAGDPDRLANELKKHASIKRDGKKDFNPAKVEILRRDSGSIVLYLFPRTMEFTRDDHRIEFDAHISRFHIRESFFTEDMIWQGKQEL
jgi:hypothetical protein